MPALVSNFALNVAGAFALSAAGVINLFEAWPNAIDAVSKSKTRVFFMTEPPLAFHIGQMGRGSGRLGPFHEPLSTCPVRCECLRHERDRDFSRLPHEAFAGPLPAPSSRRLRS